MANPIFQFDQNTLDNRKQLTELPTGEIVDYETPLLLVITVLDLGGNVCEVPVNTGAVPSENLMVDQIYTQHVLNSHLQSGGVPIFTCPHTTQHSSAIHGVGSSVPLVPLPIGESACGGEAKGCKHWHALKDARRASAAVKYNKENSQKDSVLISDVENIARALGISGAALQNLKETAKEIVKGK